MLLSKAALALACAAQVFLFPLLIVNISDGHAAHAAFVEKQPGAAAAAGVAPHDEALMHDVQLSGFEEDGRAGRGVDPGEQLSSA